MNTTHSQALKTDGKYNHFSMAVHKGFRVPQKSALRAGKENLPPSKKARRTISVSTLFEQKPGLRRKAVKDAQDVFGPKSAGVSKVYTSSRTGKTAEQHPLYRKLLGMHTFLTCRVLTANKNPRGHQRLPQRFCWRQRGTAAERIQRAGHQSRHLGCERHHTRS